MQKIALPLVACLLAIAASGASAQTIYKWRDASGQMHIGDTPPPVGTPAKDVVTRQAPGPAVVVHDAASASSGAAPGAGAGDSELQKKKAKADKDKADAAAAAKAQADQKNADARAQNCASAQQAARTMQAGGRISRVNASGEKEFLDDAAIASELKRAQDAVAQSCTKP